MKGEKKRERRGKKTEEEKRKVKIASLTRPFVSLSSAVQ